MNKDQVMLSGGFGSALISARGGYLPVCLERAPLAAFAGIPIYLRSVAHGGGETFTLYCSNQVRITHVHRDRLKEAGAKFVYIPVDLHGRFRKQTEASLGDMVAQEGLDVPAACDIIYQTGVELLNELMIEPDVARFSTRLRMVSGAMAAVVVRHPAAFAHLFAAAHHDFYTATHSMNVAAWMTPLAYAMGITDREQLDQICLAGLLHDIGKAFIPPEIFNRKGKLSAEEWEIVRRHPVSGHEHLKQFRDLPAIVLTVAAQHHERLDGSGYPSALRTDQIDPISRMCAVVDSFDAMTALRPFKERTMGISDAMNTILSLTPSGYDPQAVEAWVGLLRSAESQGVLPELLKIGAPGDPLAINRRRAPRFSIKCPSRMHMMELAAQGWRERHVAPVVSHSISRYGLGLLSQVHVRPGEHLRVELKGEGTLSRTDEGVCVRCRGYRDGWYEVGVEFAPLESLGAVETSSAQVA